MGGKPLETRMSVSSVLACKCIGLQVFKSGDIAWPHLGSLWE